MEIRIKNSNRLDKYLINEIGQSRSKIQKMIEKGEILVNGERRKSSYKVNEGDLIWINDNYKEDIKIISENIPLDIVYEDEYLLVVNKPSGLVVHPGAGNHSHTLANALLYHIDNLSHINGEVRPGIVHRIDADTSGLLVIAKTDQVHTDLAQQISSKSVTRKYLALVSGVILEDTATIDAPIGRDPNDRKKNESYQY